MRPAVLWWASAALDTCAADAAEHTPLETGGVLLGWRSGPDAVVAAVVGAGPAAERGRTWFRPDHDWQQEQIDRAYEVSGRTVGYLGDWHSHPGGTPSLSRTDLRTLHRIATHDDARVRQPVMAVLAGGPDWKIAARQPARPGRRRTQPMTIRPYRPPP